MYIFKEAVFLNVHLIRRFHVTLIESLVVGLRLSENRMKNLNHLVREEIRRMHSAWVMIGGAEGAGRLFWWWAVSRGRWPNQPTLKAAPYDCNRSKEPIAGIKWRLSGFHPITQCKRKQILLGNTHCLFRVYLYAIPPTKNTYFKIVVLFPLYIFEK